jgi:hypothetical protein
VFVRDLAHSGAKDVLEFIHSRFLPCRKVSTAEVMVRATCS